MENSEFCEEMAKSKNANCETLIIYHWFKRLIYLGFWLELCKTLESDGQDLKISTRIKKGQITISSDTSPLVGIQFLAIPFFFDFAFKMHIKEKSFKHSMNKIKLAYQTVCYYGLKRVGVRNLEEL